jgi:hypothetical protein
VRGEPAALEGVKQLQRASLPTARVRAGFSREKPVRALVGRIGRPAALALCECVTALRARDNALLCP